MASASGDLEHANGHGDGHVNGTNREKHETLDKQTSKVGFRGRIDHFTWSWFTVTQSTGGVAVVISETPHQFDGIQTAGVVIFILNLVLFLMFIAAMTTRFILNPSKIKKSFIHPPECFFFGSFWLTFATVIICMERFAVPHTGPWIIVAIRVCFWIYAAITFTSTTIHIAAISHHTPVEALKMNPAWFLLIFNAMLTGTVASAIASSQPPAQRLPILVAGVAYQGLGWIVASLFLVFFIADLMQNGLPPPDMRPALFMPVGSSGFTIVALIGCAGAAPDGYQYFAVHPTAKEVLQIVALWVGVFMWMFTFFLFALALVCNVPAIFTWVADDKGRRRPVMQYRMGWWAMIFPNVGFTLATINIGQELQSQGILWVGTAQTLILIAVWLLDLALLVKSVLLGDVMWPGKDEDKDA